MGNVVPQSNGESSKVKVKVRINLHGIFSVAAASMVEKIDSEAAGEEPMEVDTETQPAKVENGEKEEEKGETVEDGSNNQPEEQKQEVPEAEQVCSLHT